MDQGFYLDQFYPLQDQVLNVITAVGTGFHLTGGTALSRGYLNHRYSDDLDFFVNDEAKFGLWADRIVEELAKSIVWDVQVNQREERFMRLNLKKAEVNLKIDLINDVPSRVGKPWLHPVLGWIDTAENILANKITAVLDRSEPKDLADIWGLCCRLNLSLQKAITGAQGKATGVFPADLARVICSVSQSDWEVVRWIEPPNPIQFISQLNELGKSLIFP